MKQTDSCTGFQTPIFSTAAWCHSTVYLADRKQRTYLQSIQYHGRFSWHSPLFIEQLFFNVQQQTSEVIWLMSVLNANILQCFNEVTIQAKLSESAAKNTLGRTCSTCNDSNKLNYENFIFSWSGTSLSDSGWRVALLQHSGEWHTGTRYRKVALAQVI